jgi:hypothetical protein
VNPDRTRCREGDHPWFGAKIYRYITFYMLSLRGNLSEELPRALGWARGKLCHALPEIGRFHLRCAWLSVDNLRAQDNFKVLLVAGSLCCLFEKGQVLGIG